MTALKLEPASRPRHEREERAEVRRSIRPSAETKEKIRRSVAAWWARKREEE